MHHDPVEVVFDHAADAIIVDGAILPFPMSSVHARAAYEDGSATAVISISVDSLRIVPPVAPEPVDEPEPLGAEEIFEKRLQATMDRQRVDHGR